MTDIPAGDKGAVRRHIGQYYAKMRREWEDDDLYPPWERSSSGGIEVAIRDLTENIRALAAILTPGQPTLGRGEPPKTGGEPDQIHSLLDNLRAYANELAGRR